MTTLVRNTLREYLIGSLDEAERERLEESLLSSDDLYDELLIAEDELVDDYVQDRLKPDEVEKLRAYLDRLPEGRKKVAFARALRLRAEAGGAPNRKKASRIFATAAAIMIAILAGFWANENLRREPERSEPGRGKAPKAHMGAQERRAADAIAEAGKASSKAINPTGYSMSTARLPIRTVSRLALTMPVSVRSMRFSKKAAVLNTPTPRTKRCLKPSPFLQKLRESSPH